MRNLSLKIAEYFLLLPCRWGSGLRRKSSQGLHDKKSVFFYLIKSTPILFGWSYGDEIHAQNPKISYYKYADALQYRYIYYLPSLLFIHLCWFGWLIQLLQAFQIRYRFFLRFTPVSLFFFYKEEKLLKSHTYCFFFANLNGYGITSTIDNHSGITLLCEFFSIIKKNRGISIF